MPQIDLSILNQRQTPAFYADVLANRPAAGFIGRIFVSTNTYAFYRDNGTSWDLIGGPGTGTITGSGTAGTIPLWSGASTIGDSILTQSGSTVELKGIGANDAVLNIDTTTGDYSRIEFQNAGILKARSYWVNPLNQLVYGTYITGGSIRFETDNNISALLIDSSQNTILYGSLGVGTTTPGAIIDAHSAVNVIAQLNQTVATNNSLLAFQNGGAGLWRIGNFYNSGANDYGVYDVIGAAQPFTIKKTTGQVLIGTSTVGSGKLVVASATGDNGVQIVGASAPSLRIDNAESGPTKRAGLGISTASNNFIQGSTDRDFCMFNGSTTASPILFGVYDAGAGNVQEAARISSARNFLIGTTTDAGNKLQVSGTAYISGNTGVGTSSPSTKFEVYSSDLNNIFVTNPDTSGATTGSGIGFKAYNGTSVSQYGGIILTSNSWSFGTYSSQQLNIGCDGTGGIGLRTANSASIQFFTGGTFGGISTEKMRLAGSTGNLLIGTTTDAGQKLQVNGDLNLIGLSLESGKSFSGFYMPIYISGTKYFLPIYS